MRLFLDTANLDEIREGASFGILDGVTTNPSLAAREKKLGKSLLYTGRYRRDGGEDQRRPLILAVKVLP